MKIVEVKTVDQLRQVAILDAAIFPDDEPCEYVGRYVKWWLAYEQGFSEPVAFAGRHVHEPDVLGLTRCGVLPRARGKGLQRKLIKRRLRGVGCDVITYTVPSNPTSGNNLIACGFRLYEPHQLWAGEEVNYWIREYI